MLWDQKQGLGHASSEPSPHPWTLLDSPSPSRVEARVLALLQSCPSSPNGARTVLEAAIAVWRYSLHLSGSPTQLVLGVPALEDSGIAGELDLGLCICQHRSWFVFVFFFSGLTRSLNWGLGSSRGWRWRNEDDFRG